MYMLIVCARVVRYSMLWCITLEFPVYADSVFQGGEVQHAVGHHIGISCMC
jgi:hypothetical protein